MATLKDCLMSAYRFLIPYVEELNNMNVFPIADKDTGSNLCKTFEFVLNENLTSLDIKKQLILHARGCSGNIFALFFREWPETIENISDLKIQLSIAEKKILSCINPVEGTVWTAMKSYPHEVSKMEDFFKKWLNNIENSIIESPNTLPILDKYNTLDSGAIGFYYMMCGIVKELGIQYNPKHFFVKRRQNLLASNASRYCTEVIITSEISEEEYLSKLTSLGDSLIHYRDGNQIKIHIHTNNPEKIEDLSNRIGKIEDWKVEDMLVN